MTFVQSQPVVMARPDMSRLSQETLAILGVGVALAALILTDSVGVRGEFQAVRAEIQAVQTEARADREAMRAEARADREAFQEQILRLAEQHQEQILRLTEQQGVLGGQVEVIRNQLVTGG